jgi:kumamolisin
MSAQITHVKFSASELKPYPGAVREGPVAGNEPVRFDVLVRRRKLTDDKANAVLAPLTSDRRKHLSRDEFRENFGADPTELERVAKALRHYGLRAEASDLAKRTVTFTGTASAVSEAFKVELVRHSVPGKSAYRTYEGALQIPADIADLVEGVVGLDRSPKMNPHFRTRPHFPPPHPLTPSQVAQAYNFPPFTSGAGQTIGIIELGGGFLASDITAFFLTLGVAPPTIVIASGTNSPSPSGDDDGEVTLDIEVAGGCAPGAKIAVYFGPDHSFDTLFSTLQTAIHDTTNNPAVISVSLGGVEDWLSGMSRTNMENLLVDASALGITVCVASGDFGASDLLIPDGSAHVDFPASAPHALACGGTELGPLFETAWNDGVNGGATGGGISAAFAVPSYQVGLNMPAAVNPGSGPGRGLPDVAGNAARDTAYLIVFRGLTTAMWGTSAVAPLWAALIARLNEVLGFQLGFVNPTLYRLRGTSAFKDITFGNNDINNDNGGYAARTSWDCCTGLGAPVGTELLKALTFSKLSQFFAPNQITCGYSDDAELFLDKVDTVDINVLLVSDLPQVVSVDPIVTIKQGFISTKVTCRAAAVQGSFAPRFVNVHATYAGTTLTVAVEVVPPRIVSLTLSPDTVTCGDPSECTVTLDRPSLNGVVDVELFCGAPGFASIPQPPKLTINQNDDSGSFTITTPAISTAFPPAHASILAIYRSSLADPGTSASAVLTVQSRVVAGMVKSLVLNPTKVTEGNRSYGLVTLLQPVPTNTVVGLAANDLLASGAVQPPLMGTSSSVAAVPSSITVLAGHTQAQFTINTIPNSVSAGSTRKVQISAAAGPLPVFAVLTVQH